MAKRHTSKSLLARYMRDAWDSQPVPRLWANMSAEDKRALFERVRMSSASFNPFIRSLYHNLLKSLVELGP